jgi:hypothetical protein
MCVVIDQTLNFTLQGEFRCFEDKVAVKELAYSIRIYL